MQMANSATVHQLGCSSRGCSLAARSAISVWCCPAVMVPRCSLSSKTSASACNSSVGRCVSWGKGQGQTQTLGHQTRGSSRWRVDVCTPYWTHQSILDASVAMCMCCALSPSSVDPTPTLCLPTKPTCIIRARGLLCTRLSIRPCPRRLTRTAAGACTQGSPSTCGGGKGGRGEACGWQGRAGQAQVNKYALGCRYLERCWAPIPSPEQHAPPHNNRQTDEQQRTIG